MKTNVTEMLQIKYPIIAGNMMNISKPEFVAACSNAGGLGIMASVMYRTAEPLREAIRQLQSLTSQPFAVNVNLFPMLRPVKQDQLIQVMIDEGVKIIETSGHEAPEKFIPMFKQNDVLWIHKCAGVRYALKAEKLGADIVEVVGWENGGATGKFDIGTLVLAAATVDALKIPVIAGGGIADGRGLVAVLALGAQAGLMGTRLMMTTECPIHDNLKQALVKSSIYDTTIVMRSVDATHRVWNNEAAKHVLELEQTQSGQGEIFEAAAGAKSKLMYDEGDITAGIVACSQSVGLAKDIIPVQELFDRVMAEAEAIIGRLYSL
ncbi:MAG TPA: nitronate monooxygenase [Candidatus Lokiarchaeia archaeon]|nr:nitronate monooxygenase [Candidatus Lokiarchaeia archaeon]